MVPGAGLEPARSRLRGILSPLCLPIPPPGQIINHLLWLSLLNFPNLFQALLLSLFSKNLLKRSAQYSIDSPNLIIACMSFGKQLPPKPLFPSGPGTGYENGLLGHHGESLPSHDPNLHLFYLKLVSSHLKKKL